jgi:hypothetical protein
MRRNVRCLVTAGKHVNNIRAIARNPPITTIEGLLKAVFSVSSAPWPHTEDSRRAIQFSRGLAVEWSSARKADKKWRYS